MPVSFTAEAALEDPVTVAFKKAIKVLLDICQNKLDEYYQKYNQLSVYSAAVVLHPDFKQNYFKLQQTTPKQQDQLRQTKKHVKVFQEKKYKIPGRETTAQPRETQHYHTDCKANPLAEFVKSDR